MASGDKSYIDDIGTVITVDVGVDITDATSVKLLVKKPDGTEVEWTGTVYSTQYIRYTVVEDDFDQAGTYKVQSYVVTPDGTWKGETDSFKVYDEYK